MDIVELNDNMINQAQHKSNTRISETVQLFGRCIRMKQVDTNGVRMNKKREQAKLDSVAKHSTTAHLGGELRAQFQSHRPNERTKSAHLVYTINHVNGPRDLRTSRAKPNATIGDCFASAKTRI